MLERSRKTGKEYPEILAPFIFEVEAEEELDEDAVVGELGGTQIVSATNRGSPSRISAEREDRTADTTVGNAANGGSPSGSSASERTTGSLFPGQLLPLLPNMWRQNPPPK